MLTKLKEYKEFIAILVFFIGGFIWLEKEFPKKSDLKSEVKILECMLDKYMTLTQRQIRGQELAKRIQELNHKIKTMLPSGAGGSSPLLSPAMGHELDQLKKDLADNREDLKKNNDAMKTMRDELERNVCGKEVP
jgi:hypothetical protein